MEQEKKEIVRKSRKNKIRSLTDGREKTKGEKIKKIKKGNLRNFAILVSSLIISIILYQLQYGSCEFWAAYERNFNKIVYGDEYYCQRKINTELLYEKLTESIIEQKDAVQLIKGSLNLLANNDEYIQMIFSGSTGVGKTLASQIIANNFVNPYNVQKYSWNIHEILNLFEKTQMRLSKCGYNLIILDDLENDHEAINFVKKFEEQTRMEAKSNSFKVILIFIFKKELSELEKEDLKSFVIIDFLSFTLESFIECIKIHEKLYNITISPQEWEELKQIDYTSSGCKLISKKLTTVE